MALPRMLAWAQFYFRALGRWSNPPSRPDVSTRTRALLPWVSSFVRLSDSSPRSLGPASYGALRRYQPAFPALCSSSSVTRGPRLAVRTPCVEGTARLPCRLTHGHDALRFLLRALVGMEPSGVLHQFLPGTQKMRSSRKRPPKQPCPFGPLDSEIEDLSSFVEVAFHEEWLRDSRARASSRDEVPALHGLRGASCAPGFTVAFRRPAAKPWKPGS